jgi:CRISPR-associated protein Cas2
VGIPVCLAKLRSRLNKVIKPKEDSILFFPLCACCQGKIEGIGGVEPVDRTIFFA